jgi:Ca2+-binding EF-hand superfamily protein
MGATCSSDSKVMPLFDKEVFNFSKFRLLALSKNNVNDLYILFGRICGTSNEISVHDALVAVNAFQSPFVEKIFDTMRKANGLLDFEHFVLAIWSFCSLSFDMMGNILFRPNILHSYNFIFSARYVFTLYDTQNTGIIRLDTILQILKDTHEGTPNAQKTTTLLSSVLMTHIPSNKVITQNSFISIVEMHYALFGPVLAAQSQMRRKMMGMNYWNEVTKSRTHLSNGEYCDVHKYMEMVRLLSFIFNFLILITIFSLSSS